MYSDHEQTGKASSLQNLLHKVRFKILMQKSFLRFVIFFM